MVAVISTGHSIRRVFFYNEQKVQEGVAECLMAANYPLDLDRMTQNHRLNRLLKQAALNPNVSRNSVHISLNFAPTEQFSKAHLQEIATAYMDKIGFGDQPYLVYQHNDAGHPHIHIVTIKVRPDGSRIDTQNIGKNQSEKARKQLEAAYNLVRAEDMKKPEFQLKPANAQKVYYGRTDSRRAISNVLAQVLDSYKYASLPELNAILKQYNIVADRGSEESTMFKKKGLFYRILDEHGNKIGVPIKASAFYNKPTLSNLEKRFVLNASAKKDLIKSVRSTIDLALLKSSANTLHSYEQSLKRVGIDILFRQNAEGKIYGITYIDHQRKVAFNGSELGKSYSAKAVLDQYNPQPDNRMTAPAKAALEKKEGKISEATDRPDTQIRPQIGGQGMAEESLLDQLMQAQQVSGYMPFELSGKKKRRRKKRGSNKI